MYTYIKCDIIIGTNTTPAIIKVACSADKYFFLILQKHKYGYLPAVDSKDEALLICALIPCLYFRFPRVNYLNDYILGTIFFLDIIFVRAHIHILDSAIQHKQSPPTRKY